FGNSVSIAIPTTTGSGTNLLTGSGSAPYTIQRQTSALKYKEDVTDAPYLADIVLRPTKHWRKDDQKYLYGFIADELAAQDPILSIYDEEGEIENYDDRM